MYRLFTVLFPFIFLMGCQSATSENQKTNASTDSIAIADQPVTTETMEEKTDDIAIMVTGRFSEGGVTAGSKDRKWTGLFAGEDGKVAGQPATVTFEKIRNEMVDGPEEKTGRKVTCLACPNAPIMLISGVMGLTAREVTVYSGTPMRLYPGEALTMGEYTLTATGKGKSGELIEDYELTISGMKNGKQISQIILGQEWFDDAMIEIFFAGDIDGDGLPDLYLDTSYKYSFSNPALFLSSRARPQELLTLVAELRIFAC